MGVGIEDLAVVEDAFDRWQGGADEEVYLLLPSFYPLFEPSSNP